MPTPYTSAELLMILAFQNIGCDNAGTEYVKASKANSIPIGNPSNRGSP